jgi:hypothetical protein
MTCHPTARFRGPSTLSRPLRSAPDAAPGLVTEIQPGTLSIRELVIVTLYDDAWIEAATVIPEKAERSVGRPRIYPARTWTLWPELRAIWKTNTAVERELGRGGWWAYIVREDRRLHPDLPPLPLKPPTRQAFEYIANTYQISDQASPTRRRSTRRWR